MRLEPLSRAARLRRRLLEAAISAVVEIVVGGVALVARGQGTATPSGPVNPTPIFASEPVEPVTAEAVTATPRPATAPPPCTPPPAPTPSGNLVVFTTYRCP